jgi:hypothetical protein
MLPYVLRLSPIPDTASRQVCVIQLFSFKPDTIMNNNESDYLIKTPLHRMRRHTTPQFIRYNGMKHKREQIKIIWEMLHKIHILIPQLDQFQQLARSTARSVRQNMYNIL